MSEGGTVQLTLSCRDFVLAALRAESRNRGDDLAWIDRERFVVAVAANTWAEAHGYAARVTVADVERIEVQAVGHIDYATKLALYIAEAITHTGRLAPNEGDKNG